VERHLEEGEWCVKKQEKVQWRIGDNSEVETVRFIFEQRAQGMGYVVIAKRLNDRGVLPARRGRWRSKSQNWNGSSVKGMLDNPVYYGARVYNRYSSSKIVAHKKGRIIKQYKFQSWANSPEEWIVVENAHPPIIEKELWERVQDVSRKIPKRRPNMHLYFSRYILTGVMRCIKCGYPFQGLSSSVRGKPYLRYIDGGWKANKICDWTNIRKDKIEPFVVEAIAQTLEETALRGGIEQHVARLLMVESGASDEDLENAKRQHDRLGNKIQNLLSLAEDGVADSVVLRDRLRELERERATLTSQIQRAERVKAPKRVEDAAQLVRLFIQDFRTKFEHLPIEIQKLVVQKCVFGIDVDPDGHYADVYVRTIPAVTPEIEKALNSDESKALVATAACARNRKNTHCTTFRGAGNATIIESPACVSVGLLFADQREEANFAILGGAAKNPACVRVPLYYRACM
jgi:hypothetical protein